MKSTYLFALNILHQEDACHVASEVVLGEHLNADIAVGLRPTGGPILVTFALKYQTKFLDRF